MSENADPPEDSQETGDVIPAAVQEPEGSDQSVSVDDSDDSDKEGTKFVTQVE